MRLGVIADIHANLAALDAALARLDEEGVDGIVAAGDLVGYGAQPDECVERLAVRGVIAVAGNHDLIATGQLSDTHSGGLARDSLDWTRRRIGADTRDYLENLPLRTTVDPGVIVAHGSMSDPEAYVRGRDQACAQLAALRGFDRRRLLVLGHTHEPWLFGESSGTVLRDPGVGPLRTGERHLLNPGSVGQSRTPDPRVRLAVLDLAEARVALLAVPYDQEACRAALQHAGRPVDSCHRPPVGLPERMRRHAARARRRALRVTRFVRT